MLKQACLKRYFLLTLSLLINALGVALITKALLGTSPISSLPYVVSIFTPYTLGEYTFLQNMIFILIEVALMGWKNFNLKRAEILIQIPVVLVFSFAIDLWMYCFAGMEPVNYAGQLLSLLIGCCLLSIGIGWAVKADVAMNPGEYVVRVIANRVQREFGFVKLWFDISLVTLACVVSLVFLHNFSGIREGTLVSALLVGPIVRFSTPYWRFMDKWLLARDRRSSVK